MSLKSSVSNQVFLGPGHNCFYIPAHPTPISGSTAGFIKTKCAKVVVGWLCTQRKEDFQEDYLQEVKEEEDDAETLKLANVWMNSLAFQTQITLI